MNEKPLIGVGGRQWVTMHFIWVLGRLFQDQAQYLKLLATKILFS